jgi:hypothetical protein
MRTNYITKQTIALALAIATGVGASAQGVAIGDKDFAPNAAAMLDVQSKNKGVLFPRVTYTQLATLAGKGITAEVKGFTSKAGKEFSAKLKLDGEHRVVFEFAGKQNQK